MNREEEIAQNYLKSLGHKNLIFEPDGNTTPDFSIDEKIAVEIRRLNQNFFTEYAAKGLEEDRIPLFKLLQSTFSEFDSLYKGNSYWVSVRFGRPIGSAKIIKKAVRKSLTEFLKNPSPVPFKVNVTDRISFSVYPDKPIEGRLFLFAGGTDRESGGFVLSEFKKNFEFTLKEKSIKIEKNYAKYNSWWLVLVDQIAHWFNEAEKNEIQSIVFKNSCWTKVIVLDSLTGKKILEV